MSRIERSNEKYSRAFAKRIKELDEMEPEASFDNVDDMLKWLNDESPRAANDRRS